MPTTACSEEWTEGKTRKSRSCGQSSLEPVSRTCLGQIASIWFRPDSLEKMSLALLASGVRWARDDKHTPISAKLATVVLPVVDHMGAFAGSAVFMPDTSYGRAGLLEARHALKSGSETVSESDLADLDDLISTHGERYREYLGGREAYGLAVQV